MDLLEENNLLELDVTEETKTHLTSIALWSNIYAIISFVNLALGLITIIYSMVLLSNFNNYSSGISRLIGYLFTTAISLLLNITLFVAAKSIKAGIDGNDQSKFNIGIRKLNSFFKITGIIFIVAMVVMVLVIVIAIISNAFGMFNSFR